MMNEIARRYAAAFYELDSDTEKFSRTAGEILDCQPLRQTLEDPSIDWREKVRVLARLPLFQGETLLLHFYQLLVKKGRFGLLAEINQAYQDLHRQENNTALCRMTCVRVPDGERLEKIQAELCKRHKKDRVELEITTNPNLLGGFVLEIDGVTYDHSVQGRLTRLERQLQGRRII
jgi:F-type H+-transporting ATPase subunit delta